MGLLKKPEDVLTYAIYPQVGLKFLKGEATAEFTSDMLPLPIDHKFTRSMAKQFFPEHEEIWLETTPPEARKPALTPTEFEVEVDGEPYAVKITPTGFATSAVVPVAKPKDVEGAVKSSMQGTIMKLKVQKGDEVEKGDVLLTIEAMKMEQELTSDYAGAVKDIFIHEGDSVKPGDVLLQVL